MSEGDVFAAVYFTAPEPKSAEVPVSDEELEEYVSELLTATNGDRRSLQSSDRSIVNIDRCVFQDNQCSQERDNFNSQTYIMVETDTLTDLTITQTVFRNNALVDCAAIVSHLCNMRARTSLLIL